jgi:DNA-binding MarR family transcriptional regulator
MQLQPFAAILYDALCSMHRRNRTVASAYDTALSALESTTLPEIEANPGINLIDIKARLHLDQVTTTRLIQGLTKEGLVTQEKSKTDKRYKELRLTAKGRKLFDSSAERAFVTFQSAFDRVPPKDREFFLRTFTLFNDGLNANTAAELPKDPAAMREVRRVSRVLGLLSRSMFGFPEVSPLEWHIFDLLSKPEAASYVVDLADVLGALPKTVAALVNRLAAKDLVKQTINPTDKRFRTITLTPSGRALHKKRRAAAEELLSRGLASIPADERRRYVELFGLYAGTTLPETATVATSSLLIRRVTEQKQLPQLRSFIYEERFKQKLTHSNSEVIIGENSVSYSVWLNDRIVGIASFTPTTKPGTWRIAHLLWTENYKNSTAQASSVSKILDQFVLLTSCSMLLADDQEISSAIRSILPGRESPVIART